MLFKKFYLKRIIILVGIIFFSLWIAAQLDKYIPVQENLEAVVSIIFLFCNIKKLKQKFLKQFIFFLD